MSSSAVIEVFADVWCPFTHVGLRAVAEHRRIAGREDVAIVVRAWPLELVNEAPMSASGAAAHADELRTQVAPSLFSDLDVARFPTTTLPALALTERAYRHDNAVGESVAFALRDALFEEGLDIGDPDVLALIATRHGVDTPEDDDRERVLADWAEGRQRGVLGSPHFFCGDNDMFCPTLQIERDPDSHLNIVRNTERLGEFLERCLALR
jgi:predicted DsbA family dithiol-disulfide isomerase